MLIYYNQSFEVRKLIIELCTFEFVLNSIDKLLWISISNYFNIVK